MKSKNITFQWEGETEGINVENAIRRNEKKLVDGKLDVSPKLVRSIFGVLDNYIREWLAEFRRSLPLRPKEQSDVVNLFVTTQLSNFSCEEMYLCLHISIPHR